MKKSIDLALAVYQMNYFRKNEDYRIKDVIEIYKILQ